MRSIAKAAFDTDPHEWSTARGLALLPGGAGAQLRQAINDYEHKLLPLSQREPLMTGPMTKSVRDGFAPLCAKLHPSMEAATGHTWVKSLILSFSDLPAFVTREAQTEALHTPFRFPSEMETGVRANAERILNRHRTAVRRLRAMLDEIHRASHPVAALPPQPGDDQPMTLDEIRKTPAHLRAMGVRVGSILPLDLAMVEAEEARVS